MAAPPPNWFLALVVPESAGLAACAAGLPEGIRALTPADLHLTVAFLGACGEERARRAWRATAARRQAPLVVRPGPWRAMGPPRRPSAWALTLAEGHDPVAALIGAWREPALAAAEAAADPRAPLPHITLARPAGGWGAGEGEAPRRAMALWLPGAPVPQRPFPLEEIALYTRAEAEAPGRFRFAARRRLDAEEP